MTAVLPRRPDLPGTSPGQAAKDVQPSGSRPRNGEGTARSNIKSERPSRKVTFPICSVVKAGEPCRGLAWGGEPESLDVGNLWPRKERGNLRVPRGVRLRSPAHRGGRRPPPPAWGGGGVRPAAPLPGAAGGGPDAPSCQCRSVGRGRLPKTGRRRWRPRPGIDVTVPARPSHSRRSLVSGRRVNGRAKSRSRATARKGRP